MMIDTSALVAYFDADDPHHRKARQAMAGQPWHIIPGVLAELTFVVRRHAKNVGLDGNTIARQVLQALRDHPSYREVQDHDSDEVARLYAQRSALSYVDAWILERAKALGVEVLTFDERLRVR